MLGDVWGKPDYLRGFVCFQLDEMALVGITGEMAGLYVLAGYQAVEALVDGQGGETTAETLRVQIELALPSS